MLYNRTHMATVGVKGLSDVRLFVCRYHAPRRCSLNSPEGAAVSHDGTISCYRVGGLSYRHRRYTCLIDARRPTIRVHSDGL